MKSAKRNQQIYGSRIVTVDQQPICQIVPDHLAVEVERLDRAVELHQTHGHRRLHRDYRKLERLPDAVQHHRHQLGVVPFHLDVVLRVCKEIHRIEGSHVERFSLFLVSNMDYELAFFQGE